MKTNELIEILRDESNPNVLDYIDEAADALEAQQKRIEDLEQERRWIPVTERMPQDDLPFGALCETVQVLLDDGTVTVGWCNRGLKCWYYMPIQATNFVGHDYDKTPVIAWQSLAQPPKGE